MSETASIATNVTLIGDAQDADGWSFKGAAPMTTLNMYYTTSRTNVTIHDGPSSSPALYYLESHALSRTPSVFLRHGDSKSAPMVAFVNTRWTARQMVIGLGDSKSQKQQHPDDQALDKMCRERNNFRRSDYHVTVLSDDDDEGGGGASGGATKQPRTLTWRKDRSASFKTVYACIDDEDGSVVGRLRSGGMFNWKKGGEIDVLDSLTESQTRLFLVAAGGIWALEALNYQSLERGFDKKDAPSENAK